MNEKMYEALEVCLRAIETGAEIESVLTRYPQMADELRPILETSVQAQSLVAHSVPEDAMRRGRAARSAACRRAACACATFSPVGILVSSFGDFTGLSAHLYIEWHRIGSRLEWSFTRR